MKILIVEDEPGIANFLKQGLEEESFAVDVALDGKDGLFRSLSGDYDLLLLDWIMPGISGIEVCRRFREHFNETPVIFLTAKDTSDEAIYALQAGANDFVKKPFNFAELLERIRVQFRKTNGKHVRLEQGPLVMDISSHQVFVNDREINLTQKEFQLLEFLIRNKGIACTRAKILKEVWEIRFAHDSGVIDVNINSIRNKLGHLYGDKLIRTIRGVGYMVNDE